MYIVWGLINFINTFKIILLMFGISYSKTNKASKAAFALFTITTANQIYFLHCKLHCLRVRCWSCCFILQLDMANRPAAAQRPNGNTQGKICQFKLVLLGESAVGKSSLVLRFVKGQFHEYQESTIGAAFLTQTICLDDTTVKFEIWDTAGQER